MATLAQIRSAIDADLAALWPQIVSRQATYFGNHACYWQGIITHSVIPTDGNATAADQLGLDPGYESDDWNAALAVSSFTKPYALEIHQYNGPAGLGFVGICRVIVQGVLYVRSQDSGPEPYRTQGWAASPFVTP